MVPPEVLLEARTLFCNEPVVLAALDDLDTVLAQAQQAFPDVGVYVDLTELRGFRYHTGLVFAVYLEGRGFCRREGRPIRQYWRGIWPRSTRYGLCD